MKQNTFTKILAAGAACALTIGTAFAQHIKHNHRHDSGDRCQYEHHHEHQHDGRDGNDHGLHAEFGLHHLPHRRRAPSR